MSTPATPRATQLVTLAQRPDLTVRVPAVLATRWPEFMLAGTPGHGVDLTALLPSVPDLQVLMIDPAADEILAVGLSVPLRWDGTAAGLPAGWDGAITAAAALVERGERPDATCALSITIPPEVAGGGLAGTMIQALKSAAAGVGARAMLAPVRPVLKADYPLIPMADFLAWRDERGRPLDPWLRLHLRLGGALLGVADPAMTISGTPAQWEAWTRLPLPGSGEYVLPGALVPLSVDRGADLAVYREPNVWVAHPVPVQAALATSGAAGSTGGAGGAGATT